MNAVNQRIKDFINYLDISDAEFAKSIGVSPSKVSGWVNDKYSPNLDSLISISEKFKKLNFLWLLFGEGDMLGIDAEQHLKESVKMSGYYYPDVNAAAGLEKGLINEEITRVPIYIPSFGKDVHFVNVFGDSMYPKFCSGEIIGITLCEKEYVNFGHPYVVVFQNGDTYIKYIQKGKDEDHWILASENPKYQEKEFHLDKILRVYTIKGVITKLTM